MALRMLMPLLGQTMEEGTIIQWFKKEGDEIKEGEPLLEVMTDKANMEVEAPQSGVLRKIIAQPDEVIPVKEPIAIIGTADEPIDHLLTEAAAAEKPAGEKVAEPRVAAPTPTVVSGGAPTELISSPAARRAAREKGIDIAELAGRGTGPNGRITERDVLEYAASRPKTTPLAGKIAEELGVPVGEVAGTGIGGKITSEDILKAAAAPAMETRETPSIGATIPFSGMRKSVARNVAASAQTAVHVTLVTEVDMTECVNFRNSVLETVEKKYGVRISYTDIIVKAAARAIEDKPMVNSSLEGDHITIHDHINIGVATALDNGLVVPVVRDANLKSIPRISAEIKELVGRARSGHSTPDDLAGGTFTVTNLGVYGVTSFNPVITPGQAAILGVCAIAQKPVVKAEEMVSRPVMNLCLSFDHRIIDGAPAAEYLARVREILESPFMMFI